MVTDNQTNLFDSNKKFVKFKDSDCITYHWYDKEGNYCIEYEWLKPIGKQIVIKRKCDPVFCLRVFTYDEDADHHFWEFKKEFPKKSEAYAYALKNKLDLIDESL